MPTSLLMTLLRATATFLTNGSPQPPKSRIPLPPAGAGPLYWFPLTVLPMISAAAPRATSMPLGAMIRPSRLAGPVAVTVVIDAGGRTRPVDVDTVLLVTADGGVGDRRATGEVLDQCGREACGGPVLVPYPDADPELAAVQARVGVGDVDH